MKRGALAFCGRWLGLLLAGLFLAGCDKANTEVMEREVGYRGRARQNPFLAAERLMEELEHPVKRVQSFSELKNRNATVITPVQSFVTYGDRDLALSWVKRGGHLIVMLAGAEQWRDDWGISWTEIFKKNVRDEEEERFLKDIGVEGVEGGSGVKEGTANLAKVKVAGREFTAELGGAIKFEREPAGIDLRSSDALVSFRRGGGRITLVASAKPFRNRFISEHDHAALLNALATMEGRDEVWFLNGVRISFLRMLWEQAWMALATLGVLLIFWIWRSLRRFGPTFTPVDRSTRDFSEYLRLTGAFLWQRRQVRALLEPLQREVRQMLARRGLNADDNSACEELAARTGLSCDRVRLAVFLVEPDSAHVFMRTVQDLQNLRTKL